MVQLYSLMWILAALFGVMGLIRGWSREVIATAGIVLGMFGLFQFDAILRGTVLLSFPTDQVFFIQVLIFIVIVFFAYRNRMFIPEGRTSELGIQNSLLGGLVGCFNGYLIGGTLWYFMDINEYPLAPYILAPAANSPSAQNIGSMPMVLLGGGVGGSAELLPIAVIALFLLVLIVL